MGEVSKKIAVVGGGSWATAIVKMLCENVGHVCWWMRNEHSIDHIRKYKHNPHYLPSVSFDNNQLTLDSDIKKVISQADVIIMAVPSAFLTEALKGLTPKDFINKQVFSAIKGIVPSHNLIIGEFFNEEYDVPMEQIGVITGPSHAEEVAMEKLSYLTIACQDSKNASFVAEQLQSRYIKTSISDDIYGTEYSAVLKNVFAIAGGISHSLDYGDNFQAVLISNAIQEIKRFVDAVHPIQRDIKSSAYLGDLLVTAYSQFSRNRTFGSMIGKGYGVKSAQLEMNMIAEGYYGVKCIYEINKIYKVNMPICNAVYNVLYGNRIPANEFRNLEGELS